MSESVSFENFPKLSYDHSLSIFSFSLEQSPFEKSTFVDLYLAGNGNCVTYGRGGFGRFASLLSFNVSCNVKHVKNFFPQDCKGLPPFDQDYEK